jgi:predicted transcriptional regulator
MAIENSTGKHRRRRDDPPAAGVRFNRSRLEFSMLAKGWLRSDLATAADVSEATLFKVFAGKRVTNRTAQKITLALSEAPDRVDVAVLARTA